MPANVESMFYVRETPWHGLGTKVMEAPDSEGALIAAGLDNLLVSGRCISATHEASAAIRETPIAMAVGQAAGTAAALSCLQDLPVRALPVARVQQTLERMGASIH